LEDTDSSKSLEVTGQHVSDLRKAAASPVPIGAAASALLHEAAVGLRDAAVVLRKSADVLLEAAAAAGGFAVVVSEAAVVLCDGSILTFESVFAQCGTASETAVVLHESVLLPCDFDFVVSEEVLMMCTASVAMLPSFVLLRDAGLLSVRDGCCTPLKVVRKIPGTAKIFSVTERREKRHHLIRVSFI
jgi:hypothetical protein